MAEILPFEFYKHEDIVSPANKEISVEAREKIDNFQIKLAWNGLTRFRERMKAEQKLAA